MGYGIDRGFGYKGSPQASTVCDVAEEVVRAREKFSAPFNSAHEGFAVLLEEVEELKAAVFLRQTDTQRAPKMRAEAVQVAAMALRFIEDVCDRPRAEVARRELAASTPTCSECGGAVIGSHALGHALGRLEEHRPGCSRLLP